MPQAHPFLGVLLHAIGGLAAASFYLPYKRVRGWSWEAYWLCGGVFSWLVAPLVFALLLAPGSFAVLAAAPRQAILWTYLFGVLWGIGGLTFGLSMRYLGIALGYAVALGLCAAFGTLVPPVFHGEIGAIVARGGGRIVMLGVVACLVGIVLSGRAGIGKERELSAEDKHATVAEFDFAKGVLVAVFAGVMSACMAFAFDAAAPISKLTETMGVWAPLQNLPALIVIMAGGFTTNCLWCVYLMVRNGTLGDYCHAECDGVEQPLGPNYLFSALAGVIWYLQFFFYGMGTTQMGAYKFTSWSLHMACIIIFSTLWGIALHEWRGTSRKTHGWIAAGLAVLVASTMVIGWGNKVSADEDAQAAPASARK